MDQKTGRGVSAGGGQSSLGYLFGGGEAPKPTNESKPSVDKSASTPQSPAVDVSKQIPAGIQGSQTNNYHRAEGQNTGNFLTVLIMHLSSCHLFSEVILFFLGSVLLCAKPAPGDPKHLIFLFCYMHNWYQISQFTDLPIVDIWFHGTNLWFCLALGCYNSRPVHLIDT